MKKKKQKEDDCNVVGLIFFFSNNSYFSQRWYNVNSGENVKGEARRRWEWVT